MDHGEKIERRGVLAAGATLALAGWTSDAHAQMKRPGGLSTHVLDTYSGTPASGVRIEFFAEETGKHVLRKTTVTNSDGRTDEPIMSDADMAVCRYQLLFHVADYFNKLGVALPDPPFLDKVAIHFAIFDTKQHYHVPLLCSPWSYVTYRGS